MHSQQVLKWKTWLIMAFAFVLSLFHRGSLSVISNTVMQELQLTATQLSNAASITFYTYAIMQIPAGILLDRFGYQKVSFTGISVAGLGSLILAVSHSFFTLMIARFLIGLGTSVLFISVLKAQRTWFTMRELIKISGLLSVLGCVGAIASTFPLASLTTLIGWRTTMIVIACICWFSAFLIMTQVQEQPAEATPFTKNTRAVERFTLKQAFRECLSNQVVLRNFLVLFSSVGSTTALTGLWGISYITAIYQVSATTASFYIAFILYGLLTGSMLIHKVASRFQHQLLLIPRYAAIISLLCWIVFLAGFHGKPPLSILAVFLFTLGLMATSHLISFIDIANQLDHAYNGLASSIVNSGEFIGSSLISILIGFFLDMTYQGASVQGIRLYSSYQYIISFSIFIVVSLIGLACTLIQDKK